MPLSWNEIKSRAMKFSQEWADESSEDAEAKSFWDDFFTIFGVPRRRVATFETHVKKIDGKAGFIDLLWKGILLIEHKSRGADLTRAYKQATEYFPGLKDRDLPQYILVSDFENFHLTNLETGEESRFALKDLHKNVKLFGFIAGYQSTSFKEQDPVNVKAAERMGRLHDKLKDIGYNGHALEVYLVRILFCLFAEDAGVFERRQFQDFIEQRTSEDGSDLAGRFVELFSTLNTAEPDRLKNLDEQMAAFRYVNGALFAEQLPIASFDKDMREILLECCALDWSKISPAIFGAMFQSIMNDELRRNIGAHYTSEKNIMKVISPLFLDDLHAEFEAIKSNTKKLEEFHRKIASLKFLDPACGCGNFLIIAYRELRELELKILRILLPKKYGEQKLLDISPEILCNVDQFYGIEIEEFPAQIAQTALWLMDHQMNMKIGEEFGVYFARLPLKYSAKIVHSNALRTDWREVVKPEELNYILGNPPFIGHQWRNSEQVEDVDNIWGTDGKFGRLDYVTCWYRKAADYMAENKKIETAFVSTNSISQGEQVGILWSYFLSKGITITFAHRPFQWSNEASGQATVQCVIIGFSYQFIKRKILFDYINVKSEATSLIVNNINPYLVDAQNIVLPSRSETPAGIPQMKKGSQPTDGGHLILNGQERDHLLRLEPEADKWIRPYMGGEELISGKYRWCLWLKGISPNELRQYPEILKRVSNVKEARLKSPTSSVREYANFPTLFTQDRQPSEDYLALPEVSSENRQFIPIAFLSNNMVGSNKLQMIVGASKFHFGILSSTMHMAWVRTVSGRLESRYSYSPSVYNNFPWPEDLSDKQKQAIEAAAQSVLDVRTAHPGASLADLYDSITMPPDLVKAHRTLAAVDAAYSKKKFTGDADRVAFLFEMYQKLAAPLDVQTKAKKPRKAKVKL